MKKFKLREDLAIEVFGRKLFRVEAVVDIKSQYVKKGDIGGFIEKEENLRDNAWVYNDGKVYGNALICDNARVSDDAQVCENALIYGNAHVSCDAQVSNAAQVYGDAIVCGDAIVGGNAQVYGDAIVCGNAQVYGDAIVCGNAQVSCDKIKEENDLINITSNVVSYNITITPNYIRIGRQCYSKVAWFNFSDAEIEKMDGEKAVKWWKTWKPILQAICERIKT